jgi:hypothetical protein
MQIVSDIKINADVFDNGRIVKQFSDVLTKIWLSEE